MEPGIDQRGLNRKFWREHVERAAVYAGSDLQYCRENGLKPGTFSWNKRRFKTVKETGKIFSKVEIAPPQQDEIGRMPDPKWLSEFLKAWMGS